MLQMKKAVQIAEFKYNPSTHTIIWLFDQSSCHKAYTPYALNASKMNVNPGSPSCETQCGQGGCNTRCLMLEMWQKG